MDFGTKADLRGSNPVGYVTLCYVYLPLILITVMTIHCMFQKIVVVQRKLRADARGVLESSNNNDNDNNMIGNEQKQ
jgi:hypothetical protein